MKCTCRSDRSTHAGSCAVVACKVLHGSGRGQNEQQRQERAHTHPPRGARRPTLLCESPPPTTSYGLHLFTPSCATLLWVHPRCNPRDKLKALCRSQDADGHFSGKGEARNECSYLALRAKTDDSFSRRIASFGDIGSLAPFWEKQYNARVSKRKVGCHTCHNFTLRLVVTARKLFRRDV